ncbi:XdhC family protein [Mesorhizobium australicum]|uniref:XdhC family protein n=1 Tax=Mesorhizobium australicum TaxID=536018 RepID=UPI00333C57D7
MKGFNGTWEKFEDYVLDFAIERQREGSRVAIVTLVHVEGSSPRAQGAQMAVCETGEWTGYLSGGCIERAVVAEALDAIELGENRLVRYGRGSKYLDIQLPCGSAIELMFDVTASPLELETIDSRLRDRSAAIMRVPFVRGTGTEARTFKRTYLPRIRLIVAGVGPAAIQLCKFARLSGYEVILYSPDQPTCGELLRTEPAMQVVPLTTPNRTPSIDVDCYTAVALLFHDHEWETQLLPLFLASEAFYIGAMGSRRTHERRSERLVRLGTNPMQLDRISAPAGLFSGGKSASVIAGSVLAEIMHVQQLAQCHADATTTGSHAESGPIRHALCGT